MSFTTTTNGFHENPLRVSQIYQNKEKQSSETARREIQGMARCRVQWKLAHINRGVSIPPEIPRGPHTNQIYRNLMGKTVRKNLLTHIKKIREVNTSC